MIRFLPILAVVAGTLLFLTMGVSSKNEIPFELTSISTDVAYQSAAGENGLLATFQGRELCSNQSWPFEAQVLASVYKVSFGNDALNQKSPWVLYQKAAINNQFAVVYGEPEGCWRVAASGRSLPYSQRAYYSIFPNTQINTLTQTTDVYIVFHTTVQQPDWPVETPQAVSFLVGPEGGLTHDEIAFSHKNDFKSWQLGPRILRTETAPIAILNLLQMK